MNALRENLGLGSLQISQRDNQVNELKLEVERSREASREAEMVSQQRRVQVIYSRSLACLEALRGQKLRLLLEFLDRIAY